MDKAIITLLALFALVILTQGCGHTYQQRASMAQTWQDTHDRVFYGPPVRVDRRGCTTDSDCAQTFGGSY